MVELLAKELLVSLIDATVVVAGGSCFGCSVGFLGDRSVIHPLLLGKNLGNSRIKELSVCGRTMGLVRLFASTPVQGPLHRDGGTHPLCVGHSRHRCFLVDKLDPPPDDQLL